MVKFVTCCVDEAGQGHFRCPHCAMDRYIAVGEKILFRNSFTDTCTCGCEVAARVLFRVLGRNPLQLAGNYRMRNRSGSGKMMIKTLNIAAVDFSYVDAHRLFPGDYLDITFHLQNTEKTQATMHAIVIDVHGMRVKAIRGEVAFNLPDPTENFDI